MLARDNYSYNKYQKELARKKKKEEKMKNKLEKKNMQAQADSAAAPDQSITGQNVI